MSLYRRERWWQIYTFFNDPPGTPKDKKCLGCRVATSAGSFTLAGASFWAAKKASIKNVYYGVVLGFAGITLVGLGGITARMALEDRAYNKYITEKYQEDMRKKAESKGKLIGRRTETL